MEEQVTSLEIINAKEITQFQTVINEEIRQLIRFVKGYSGKYIEKASKVAEELVAAYPHIQLDPLDTTPPAEHTVI